MNKCRTCAKEKLCEKEEKENCQNYVKEAYTYIQKIDDKHYILRRVN